MLTIEKLKKASDILKLKVICKESDLGYSVILRKVALNNDLTTTESLKVERVLKEHGLNLD